MMNNEHYHFQDDDEIRLSRRSERSKRQEELRREREQKKRQAIVISIVAVLVVAALGCFVAFSRTGLTSAEEENTVVTEEMLPAETGFTSFKLVAAGDNLLHTKLYTEANQRAGGSGYDFDALYEGVAEVTQNADIAFINQETPVATAIAEPSSYPMFNTPSECVTDMHEIGFNVFNIASNHTLDKGADGLKATIDFMESVPDSLYVGAYYNQEEMEKLHAMEVNGLTVAFLGFTEMTNGITLREDSELEFTYTSDEAEMKSLIESANQQADVVIVSVHWGQENVFAALDSQKKLGQKFADWGADMVIGHHPHVLEEIETITSADGRKVPVIYSLGNLTSTMNGDANHIGGFYSCNVVVDNATGEISIADEEFIPAINYFTSGKNNIRIVLYKDYTEEMAARHGFPNLTHDYIDEVLRDTVGAKYVKGLE
ncbi:MAG: CapA family protein [Firmicutes bacterium]|nr:CapA family protein [Bacillota bacterium]